MWKQKVNAILAKNAGTRTNGKIASERTKDVTEEVVYNFFNTCWSLGYKVQEPANVGDRHIQAVLREWWLVRKLKPKTMQNYVSRLRIFFGWIGKSGLVRKTHEYFPEVSPKEFIVRAVAVNSKGWSSNGINVMFKIQDVLAKDLNLGLMLMMQLAFGLRRKEVIHCRPWMADRGTSLRVYPGEGKGSRPRDIPIETEFQRTVLQKVQSFIGKTKALGWEYMNDGSRATMEQKLDRYKNQMTALGITKADLGVTGHGLRAQFAENKALLDEFVPATLGGKTSNMDRETLKVRRLQVSEALGHSRDDVTAAYYGEKPHHYFHDDKVRFTQLVSDGLDALKDAKYTTPPPEDRMQECLLLVGMVSMDRIELLPSQAHALWKKFSERFGAEWVIPESGIRQAVEVAARQAILDRIGKAPS